MDTYLKIAHLAPYLPYELKGKYLLSDVIPDTKHELRDKLLRIDNVDFFLKYAKPILRPLSDLTEEIEIDSEKFVPTFKLFEIEYCNTDHVDNIRNIYTNKRGSFLETSHFGTASTSSVNITSLFLNNYWKMKQLFEWHFDVFGLIDAGLAINKNTIKQ